MNNIQSKILQLFKFIHKICIDNNIKYSLSCGSMLGAIRENKFIEWDDDGDIIFTRDEYTKFINVLKKNKLPEYVGVYYANEKKQFFDFNTRIYYKTEKVRTDEYNLNIYDGLYSYATIDIFILDNIPENKIFSFFYILKLQIIFMLAMSKRNNLNYKKYKKYEKIAVFIFSNVGKLFSINYLASLYEKCASSYKKETKKYYCSSWKPEYPGFQYEKYYFDENFLVEFEDTKLYVAKCYDKILQIDYGKDYMIPKKTHDHSEFVLNI